MRSAVYANLRARGIRARGWFATRRDKAQTRPREYRAWLARPLPEAHGTNPPQCDRSSVPEHIQEETYRFCRYPLWRRYATSPGLASWRRRKGAALPGREELYRRPRSENRIGATRGETRPTFPCKSMGRSSSWCEGRRPGEIPGLWL